VLDHGGLAWLRVVFDDPEWGEGPYWDSNVHANEIQGVPKPTVLRWQDWDDLDRRLQGELSTYVPDATLARDMLLTTDVNLTDSWLRDLHDALGALARNPVPVSGVGMDDVSHGALAYFGLRLDLSSITWTAAHCDLHWGNVTAPTLTILDWETWGKAPAGCGAATLLCTSLLRPAVSQRVHSVLESIVDTPDGRLATIAAAVRLLRFVDAGEYLDLAQPLRDHVRQLTGVL
jgi:hypothetical protein